MSLRFRFKVSANIAFFSNTSSVFRFQKSHFFTRVVYVRLDSSLCVLITEYDPYLFIDNRISSADSVNNRKTIESVRCLKWDVYVVLAEKYQISVQISQNSLRNLCQLLTNTSSFNTRSKIVTYHN